jgi:hypothetical protein
VPPVARGKDSSARRQPLRICVLAGNLYKNLKNLAILFYNPKELNCVNIVRYLLLFLLPSIEFQPQGLPPG